MLDRKGLVLIKIIRHIHFLEFHFCEFHNNGLDAITDFLITSSPEGSWEIESLHEKPN